MSCDHTLGETYDNDWQHVDGVQAAGYEFGPDREFAVGEEQVAPTEGVMVRITSPTQSEVLIAAGTIGYDTNDMMITLWQGTLCSTNGTCIRPKVGDWIELCNGERWRIRSSKKVIDGSQWRCMCRESVLESN